MKHSFPSEKNFFLTYWLRTLHIEKYYYSWFLWFARSAVVAIFVILLSPKVSAAQFTLDWKDNSDNERGFKIERSSDGQSYSQIGIVGSNVTTYTDKFVSSFIRYSYRIRSFNYSGNSGYSNTASDTWASLPTTNNESSSLIAISIRAQVRSGNSTMIAGIVIKGSGYVQILLRAIGPSLKDFGVAAPVKDPVITLFRGSQSIAQNNNWASSDNASSISSTSSLVGAFPLSSNSKDAALLLKVPAGAYTTHITGVSGSTGTALVEIYNSDKVLGLTPTANFSSISMRGEVSVGNDVIIAGFVVSGEAPKRVLIRAIGPELRKSNISNALADPILRLYQTKNGNSFQIAFNNNWSADANTISATSSKIGIPKLDSNSKSSAMVVWLEPGIYTAHGISANSSRGITLVEIHEVP